jgi:hypothetical protein
MMRRATGLRKPQMRPHQTMLATPSTLPYLAARRHFAA